MQDENQDEKHGFNVEYYMEEHRDPSIEQAREHVNQMVSNEWKQLNNEIFRLNQLPASSVSKACLNIARMAPLMYGYNDNQSLPSLKEYVKSILFDEIYLDCHLWNREEDI